ncbi:MAG TPA: hypothetical protein VFL12_04220 [Thermoanaerobaculia bacterium]|nr:hypothetical protein [Thermoanaerobaculia bacterium]
MKKVLVTLVAVATLAAFAGTASAVTCTIDHKPAATLLLPYFQTTISNTGGTIAPTPFGAGFGGDTLVTVVNASAADTLAHVVVWNRRSVPVLDFNIGLTGFDVISMSMGGVLTGTLPVNPALEGNNACGNGNFVRFVPNQFPTGNDGSASTNYGTPAFPQSFASTLAAELDGSDDCAEGGIAPNFDANGNDQLVGYVTIDMVNYCTFANPNDPTYWQDVAAGFENSLWGDYTIQSEGTTPTYGNTLVALEADVTPGTGLNYGTDGAGEGNPLRTFYARYWEDSDGVVFIGAVPGLYNGGQTYLNSIGLFSPIVGDMREPLGVNWGARYINAAGGQATFFRAWRASADSLSDLTGSGCTATEPNVFTVIWDEDEVPATQTGCQVSPCPPGETFNIPLETQRVSIADFAGSNAAAAGWVYIDFGFTNNDATVLDQAWLAYDFQVPGAFANAGIEGVQLDANSCVPADDAGSVDPILPELPTPLNADGITGSGF